MGERMFQVGEDCEVMIRVDEESEDEDFQLVSGDHRIDGVFTPVSELERCLAFDALALLGGNEYLVQQMLEAGAMPNFTPEQEKALHFCLSSLWDEPLEDLASYTPQAARVGLLFPQQRERLPHLLASSLLYSGRHTDTRMVFLPPAHPEIRLLLINMANFSGADPPIGRTPRGLPCSRLAVLYHWAGTGSEETPAKSAEKPVEKSGNQLGLPRVPTARKLSASLALEKKMLDVMDVFAIFPCP